MYQKPRKVMKNRIQGEQGLAHTVMDENKLICHVVSAKTTVQPNFSEKWIHSWIEMLCMITLQELPSLGLKNKKKTPNVCSGLYLGSE